MKYIKLFEDSKSVQFPHYLNNGDLAWMGWAEMSMVGRLASIINSALKLDFNNEDVFNDIIFNIQSELGVTDGGFAGVFFSDDSYKKITSDVEKRNLLLEYIKGEIIDAMTF